MAKNEGLALLLEQATPHWIGGREPNVDWFGKRPKDKGVTICVRLTLRDRDRLVRLLKSKRRFL